MRRFLRFLIYIRKIMTFMLNNLFQALVFLTQMTQKSLDNVTLKFVNHAKRVIDSHVTKRDRPIALSTSKRQFKEIANDFSLYSRRNDRYAAHVQASLAGSISFRTTA